MFDQATFVLLFQTILVLGALGTVRQLYLWHRSRQARRWPTAPGVITSVQMKKGWQQSSVGRGDVRQRVYSVRLSYSYRVNGREYTGTRTRFGAPAKERARSDAETRLARYSVDQAVTVHYDPAQPADCVLESSLDVMWHRSALLAAGLLLFGVLGWSAASLWVGG